ncbi:16S rRNA (cytosine967-C5)-methyltransferase [Halanaerobium saccharolyticum]|uniref:16S rRNA (cytosine(967)-C(5))-methyltransferase n=1 Tax=Halanaerobium saccharolyticum TaxID=43595 RepID=A0A4R7Z0P9_9FIRM|nr:16S rRNA (cytosine(967)-C(5))-methyltransferase RsmB [Halanaerobium saccharolyticum]RAK07364.1 16S rRNA (cytosine967-C5)-methyltransferase [Halanaerobium saccharolyticum]TDW02329.1 16S rRNA (cytosine967-C5)-methyltransferase [Halanaerobium saccharolyticum]TDX59049.1 16S rRNA (cytosine967-C5)-methyltransferase [Halanaerobium saccharolyticum]
MKNLRLEILKALLRVEKGSYSNLLLNSKLENIDDQRDKNLFTEIFYGVIRNKLYLDYIVKQFSKTPLSKMDEEVLMGLRIGVYQLFFLDKIPARAAIFESVEAVKILLPVSRKGAVSFTNGVLRNINRKQEEIQLPLKKDDPEKFLSIKYSYPIWLVRRFIKDYGLSKTEMILKAGNKRAEVIYRHNSLKVDQKEFIDLLAEDQIKYENTFLNSFYRLKEVNNPAATRAFKTGAAYIQGTSAGLASLLLDPQVDMEVLDLAAAPGGKTSHLAELMNNTGQITALDISQHRLNLVKENLSRLGVKNVNLKKGDAAEYEDNKKYDKILADLPCSGLGLIASKPEIKWDKDEQVIKRMAELQYKILSNNLDKLKIGGELLYSTCTLTREENQDLIKRILSENKDFELIDINKKLSKVSSLNLEKNNEFLELLPGEVDSEGFFYALLKKVESD